MRHCDFFNPHYLLEVVAVCGRNILLLLVDGSVAFGRLGCAKDCVITILPPVNIPGVSLAVYRPAVAAVPAADVLANELIIADEAIVQAIAGPFYLLRWC